MAATKTGVEWIGGIVSMPAYVTGEGEPYRPDIVLWLGTEGAILGSTMGKPGELLGVAADSLRSAMERPMYGRPHRPARVRVASPELADALRASHPSVDIVCASTPELDALAASLREKMAEDGETEESYLSPGIGPEAVAGLFRAAAGLFRAKPWKIVPDDRSLFSVTIDALDVHDAAISVIGQMGQSLGIVLFARIEDFEAYLDAADAVQHGQKPLMPPHVCLSFDRRTDVAPALREEIAEHGWEVAGANAYPSLLAMDEDLLARPLTAKDVTIAQAIALALPTVLSEKKALRAAWQEGVPLARTLTVSTHAGELEVTLRVPYDQAPVRYASSENPLAALAELAQDEDADLDARMGLEDEVLRRFEASPEGKTFSDLGVCHFVMDVAADYFGETIATLRPAQLRQIVFELLPRKMMIDSPQARSIIEEIRAFYVFLGRELGLEQAASCLRLLGDDAVRKLEAALSEQSNFGLAKSLMIAGRDAGFDMDTKEGIAAWMREAQGKPLPASVPLPMFGGISLAADRVVTRTHKKQKQKQRQRRKAARKARKRNR